MRELRSRRVLRVLLITLPIMAVPACADAPKTPKIRQGGSVSIQAYGGQNPACQEWTDGCVLCVSTAGHAQCSTPGIACQPAGLTCKRMSK